MSHPHSLKLFVQCLKKVPDPRSKRGKSYLLSSLLALTILGLIANCKNPAELARWSKNQGSSCVPGWWTDKICRIEQNYTENA